MKDYNTHRKAALRLILETDAIIQPLTGIGRYTLELLREFQSRGEFEDIRCFDRGRWRSPEGITTRHLESGQDNIEAPRSIASGRWSRNPAKILLRRLLPHIQRRTLYKYAESHLYHSPNYRLAEYPGRKIVTFHDLSVLKFPDFHPSERLKVLTPAIEQAALQADHVITDTEKVRQEVISYFGLPEDRVTAVYLASNLTPECVKRQDKGDYLRQLGLREDSYFLFASTLEPRKNITALLNAFEAMPIEIRRQYPLVLAGQLGWETEGFTNSLEAARRRGDVLQTGYLSNRQLSILYSGARAFVYPSIYEGFGLPLIEAQGFGLPVITSNRSCIPEVVGDAAMLIDPEDHASLSLAMQEIIEDSKLHSRLSKMGVENSRRFSWAATATQTIQVYRSVLMA